MNARKEQTGVTLVEVLVALLIFSIGALGVAILQLNALKHTDSALRSTQASFLLHDLLERVRANPDGDYALASLSQAPKAGRLDVPRDQDLHDFAEQAKRMLGDDVQGSVEVTGTRVTVNLEWSDARAQGAEALARQTLTLSTHVAPDRSVARP